MDSASKTSAARAMNPASGRAFDWLCEAARRRLAA